MLWLKMPKSLCLNGLLWSRESFEESTISDLESPSNFQVKEKKIFKSVHKQGNWTFVVQIVIYRKYNIGFWIPIKFSSQRRKKIFKSVQKQRNWTFVVLTVIWGKYNIGFWIPIKFPSQRKKLFKWVHKQGNWTLVVQRVIWGSTISDLESPSNFQVKEKNYLNRSINKKWDFCGPESHLR